MNSEMEFKRSAYAQGYGATGEWRPGKLMVESKLERNDIQKMEIKRSRAGS